MAAQKSVSNLLAKLGNRAVRAYEAHKNDETTYGNPQLPGGIEGGVAQLKEIKIGEYKEGKLKGELYYMASGIVVHPAEHNGQGILGLRTQVGPVPLCDTPESRSKRKTFNDHFAYVMNELALLGADRADMHPSNIETVIATLKDLKPYFKFRTWQGKPSAEFPDPRVVHEWNGYCDPPESNGQVPVGSVQDESGPSSSATAEFEEGGQKVPIHSLSLEQLAELAADQDAEGSEAAREKLGALAMAIGKTAEEVENSNSWEEVVEWIREAESQSSEPEKEEKSEPEPWNPAKGEHCHYHPMNPKTKKPEKKPVECEILSIDAKKKTCELKNLTTKVQYKAVPLSAVSEAVPF